MTETSFFTRLQQRRVFPIVGMYVAASWLVIELGDWVTERFGLPSAFTGYVFVAMIAMLPAVALFAYNHGAPGKDRWTKTEKIFIPLNAVAALAVVYLASPLLEVEAATETVRIPDETGAMQQFEVARQGYHRELIGFYWTNESGDEDLDWLSYGLPVMLAIDLNRVSPVLTAITPLGSQSIKAELEQQGFETALDVPQGLAVEVARNRRSAALVLGNFESDGAEHIVRASVIDTASGDEIASATVTGEDWFAAVDGVTETILEALEVEPADNQSDDPIAQHLTSSLDAMRYYTNGTVAIERDNDYPLGIAELENAVDIDPAFAEARAKLSVSQHQNGDTASARVTADQALRNGYRLSDETKFILKANRYLFDGDYDRGQRVVQMWAEVQPNSTSAHRNLAFIARVQGGSENLALAESAYDRLLELNPEDYRVWRQKAELEEQRGDYGRAAEYLERYLDNEPDSSEAYMQLSRVYQRQGDLDAAQEALEDAAILSAQPLESELGLARLEARLGRYEAAEGRLEALRNDALSPAQAVDVLNAQIDVAVLRGQIERSIALTREINEFAKAILPPAARIVTYEGQLANFTALLGRKDEALRLADSVAAQLQPPFSSYVNFTYTAIYEASDDRNEFRRWAAKTKAIEDQLPDLLTPFVAVEDAQLAIWDGNDEAAVEYLDKARSELGQSFLQTAQNAYATQQFHGGLARLYLEAGAGDRAKAELEEMLLVFPGSGYAKLILARVLLEEGDTDNARAYLDEALDAWSSADEDYIHLVEARELQARI